MVKQLVVINGKTYERSALAGELKNALDRLAKCQCPQDIGHDCVECRQSTAFGSGRYVNRIPAHTGTLIGYLCAECSLFEGDEEVCTPPACVGCGDLIPDRTRCVACFGPLAGQEGCCEGDEEE